MRMVRKISRWRERTIRGEARGRDYIIDRPTEISYALIPHAGTWEKSRIWTQSERRNEPLVTALDDAADIGSTFRDEIMPELKMPMVYKGNDLYPPIQCPKRCLP